MEKLSVQDVDRCVKCLKCRHERHYSDNEGGMCEITILAPLGYDIPGKICGCKCEFPAPERIWIAPPGFKSYNLHFWYEQPPPVGNKAFGKLVEYARVHQPPEQNLEDKNSVSPKPKAPSHSSVVIPESVSLDADQWQPIKTAPRDSSWILAVMRTGRQTVIRWGGGAWEDDNRLCRDPTYWMPLPDPPLQITGARE